MTIASTAGSSLHPVLQALGKPFTNTPATAKPIDPSLPLLQLPGVGSVQPSPDGQSYVHVLPPQGQVAQPRQVPFVGTPVKEQYDITVLRTGTHFGSLGWIFGMQDEQLSNYATPLSLIPSNAGKQLTVTASFDGNGNLVLSYTDGTNTDTVTIGCSQMPYATLTQKWQLKKYLVPTTRASFSDTNNSSAQFSQSILTFKRSESGGIITKPKSWIANQTPYQFEANKVDLNTEIYVGREQGLMGSTIADNAAVLTLSLQMQQTEAYNIYE